ncbi:MAG TPA: flagellar hook-associated protein FlgL [Solirubrobacteraceae bacterium]|jgi:flagellar hook-associated protein 3 FlgL|nr:flagellar hook-associated protein FlgL [Solirubrobacteraceae bacterium]
MIGRITNQMAAQTTLAGIETSLDRLDTTQQELSTGKRINQPSDDPSGTALTLNLNTQLANLTNYSNQVTDGTGWAQAQSSALTDITNAAQRIQELTTQAANGTQTTADMQASAQEVNQLIDEIKQDANTQYNGQYVFSGSATSTAPYQSGSNDTYGGNSGTVTRTIGPNTTLTVSANLQGVLGNGQSSGDGQLLDTLRTIAGNMQSGNSSGLNANLSSLTTNLNSLTGLSANVGATQDRLQMASSRIQTLQTNDTQVLSNTQDADMASTEINFSTQQAALTAALQAGAHIVQESLMNFLGSSG